MRRTWEKKRKRDAKNLCTRKKKMKNAYRLDPALLTATPVWGGDAL